MQDTQDTAPAAPPEDLEPVAPVEEGAQQDEQQDETPPETEEARIERLAAEKAQALAQKRINELTWKYREAERRAEALAAQQRDAQPRPGAPEPPSAASAAEPQIDDYQDFAQYQRAHDAWLLNRAFSEFEAKQAAKEQAAAARAQEEAAAREWQERYRSFEQAERDYLASLPPDQGQAYNTAAAQLDPILLDHRGGMRNPDMVRALMEAGPKVVQALAQDLELAERLVTSDPLTIGREIGKLERAVGDGGRLGRRFTKAAPPPPTLQGGGTSGQPRDYASMTDEEFTRVRQAEIDAERAARR